MSESSNTCDEHDATDVRTASGYAIQKIEVGALDTAKNFVPAAKIHDGTRQRPTQPRPSTPGTQPKTSATAAITSTLAFDLFFTSGITNNLPAMIPVTMLYGTPTIRRANRLHRKARLSHRLHRNGRRTRR